MVDNRQGCFSVNFKPGPACPAPPVCELKPDLLPRRLGQIPEKAVVAIVPVIAEVEHVEQVEQVENPVQEPQIVETAMQAVIKGPQQSMDNMQQAQIPQAQKPIKTEEIQFARAMDPDADNLQNPPCYMPQTGDTIPGQELHAGPVEPWVTSKVDWSPMSDLTGTRPPADRYGISRFSPNEWRTKNLELVQKVNLVLDRADKNRFTTNTEFERLSSLTFKTQKETGDKVRQRTQLIGKWKNSLEKAISAMADEICTMEEERIRLKKSLVILAVPESIVKECIEKRASRLDTELVRDQTEEDLAKELSIISDVRSLLTKTLEDFGAQQVENRSARERMEFDWSDKKQAYEINVVNLGLSNNDKTIMFRPGVALQPAGQTSEPLWELSTLQTLEVCEKTRQRSIALRSTLNSILMNASRDIRTQADLVDNTLTARITCTQVAVQRFENDLRKVLQNLADTENRILNLHRRIRSFDASMKVAQTRMHNRSYRPNVDNCRDMVQQELINEIHTIQSSVSAMLYELGETEKIKEELVEARGLLEHDIMLKRRTLFVDRERSMVLRSQYPSANALSGSASF